MTQPKHPPTGWRRELPRLTPLALPLLPCGAGKEKKGPIDPSTGYGLEGWQGAAFSVPEILAMNGKVRNIGTRTGAGLLALDIDGATALELCLTHDCNPQQAQTWQVHRDTDPCRLKVLWSLTPEQQQELGEIMTKALTKEPTRDATGEVVDKGEAVELFHKGGSQVLLLGQHVPSGGRYFWPDGCGPEALAPIPPAWWALTLAIAAGELGIRPQAANKVSPRSGSRSSSSWRSADPCPICRRDTTGYCSRNIETGMVRCFYGNTFSPEITHGPLTVGQTVPGTDGIRYGFAGAAPQANGDVFGVFVIDKPRQRLSDQPEFRQESEQQQAAGQGAQQQARTAPPPPSYQELLQGCLTAIRAGDLNREMEAKAELKTRFRVTDEQISTALFKQHRDDKVQRKKAAHDSVRLADVEELRYRMDGHILIGDVGLLYGPYGTGKTTLALAKMHAHATGRNLLDRDTPCEPGRCLFIATDSGASALKKALFDLGIDPDEDPLFMPGHPDQRIWIWAHEPEQGHAAWICDIHGVIELEEFIKAKGITYVAIDSAKAVSTPAGWSYTSNESVKALLQFMREVIAKPTGVFIEFLSHDGTEKGSHSGAKAWAEDPSMVCALSVYKDEDGRQVGVTAEFRKDRAAPSGMGKRTLTYSLADGELKLNRNTEVVGSCAEALLTILWDAHQAGKEALSAKGLREEAFDRFRKTHKTVENTLARIAGSGKGPNPTPVIRPRRGLYALSPAEIQKRSADASRASRPLSESGGINTKPTAAEGICSPPYETPEGGTGGNGNPPHSPRGEAIGGSQTPATAADLPESPPDGGEHHTRAREATQQPALALLGDPPLPEVLDKLAELRRLKPTASAFTLSLDLEAAGMGSPSGRKVKQWMDWQDRQEPA